MSFFLSFALTLVFSAFALAPINIQAQVRIEGSSRVVSRQIREAIYKTSVSVQRISNYGSYSIPNVTLVLGLSKTPYIQGRNVEAITLAKENLRELPAGTFLSEVIFSGTARVRSGTHWMILAAIAESGQILAARTLSKRVRVGVMSKRATSKKSGINLEISSEQQKWIGIKSLP